MKKGRFIVVDGLDGIGKGVAESALINAVGGSVFDSVQWSKENLGERPDVSLLDGYDAVLSAEPTYSGLGCDIRRTLISNSNRGKFSSGVLFRAYALDRDIQMKYLIVPALDRGIDALQSRSVATSLCYQTLNAEDEGLDSVAVRNEILRDPGNVYQLENAPNLLIIPTIGDIDELMRRLGVRDKNDDAIFEEKSFLERARSHYESGWSREIFEKAGSKVAYFDAGISVKSFKNQVVEIYEGFCSTGKVPERFAKILPS